jgi:hypothetical protein
LRYVPTLELSCNLDLLLSALPCTVARICIKIVHVVMVLRVRVTELRVATQ